MNQKFLSLRTAVIFASGHFLIELWRSYMDFAFVIPEFTQSDPGMMYLFAAVYTALMSIWLVALIRSSQGKRKGMMTAIFFGLFFLLVIDISTFLFYCPGGCPEPIFDVTTAAGLVFGILGVFGLILNVRTPQPEAQPAR